MSKKEESKVGRPKLASPELIKDSWCRIAACLSVVLVMVICGVGVLTARTPLQVLTFQSPNKIQGSVAKINDANTEVIKAKKVTKKIIKPNGEVTYVIPANEVNVIKVSE